MTGCMRCGGSSPCAACAAVRAEGLRWIDVDLDEQVIMISQQRITFGRTTTVGPPKTAASRRTIAWTQPLRRCCARTGNSRSTHRHPKIK